MRLLLSFLFWLVVYENPKADLIYSTIFAYDCRLQFLWSIRVMKKSHAIPMI